MQGQNNYQNVNQENNTQYNGQQYGGSNPYMPPPETNFNQQNFNEKLNDNKFGNDIEQGIEGPVEIHMVMRLGFIRKVYGILCLQLLVTASLMSLAFIDSVNVFLQTHMAVFWIALALSLIIVIPLICFKKLARQVPLNYVLLFSWTLCESYMLATAVSFYDPKIVMLAGIMTVAVTVSLTIYACTTKTDFSFCGGFLFCAVCILLIWGIFSIAFGFIANTLYCILGLIIYSIYLIYDTQLIMGKFGVEFSIDDYIYAALTIYIDIIQIFLYLLQLFGRR